MFRDLHLLPLWNLNGRSPCNQFSFLRGAWDNVILDVLFGSEHLNWNIHRCFAQTYRVSTKSTIGLIVFSAGASNNPRVSWIIASSPADKSFRHLYVITPWSPSSGRDSSQWLDFDDLHSGLSALFTIAATRPRFISWQHSFPQLIRVQHHSAKDTESQ